MLKWNYLFWRLFSRAGIGNFNFLTKPRLYDTDKKKLKGLAFNIGLRSWILRGFPGERGLWQKKIVLNSYFTYIVTGLKWNVTVSH